MTARFEIFRDKRGQYRFRFRAANSRIVCQSEGYKQKASAINGYKAIAWHVENRQFGYRDLTVSR
jgi:hypothetical protein